MFIGIIVGISYAFFNYTKTGPVKLLSTGGITFTSDYEYARIDDPSNGKPGYFTYKAAPNGT